MSKPFKTRSEFVGQLLDDRIPASENLHIEAREAEAWLTASDASGENRAWNDTPAFSEFVDAIANASDTERRQIDRLALKCLDGMSADDLLELRDALRSLLIDEVRRSVRYRLEKAYLNEEPIDYARERENELAFQEMRV